MLQSTSHLYTISGQHSCHFTSALLSVQPHQDEIMDLDDREAIGVVDDVDTTTEAAEKEKLNTTVGTVMNVNNIADLSTFENLLEAVGTNGRWNIIVITTCIFDIHSDSKSTIKTLRDYYSKKHLGY
ncbi:hypothetical protein Pmani_006784 [Petrolisthes manimaculis]|uniref:Uncharacterized protein n=1 Tax=Petrolisthes manimaculis TaxID=1843537 RepID=A0AAE1ULD0_9EUCA|nr:hypothetical protein Pmani_006784 [Petrolisthes manimaculis]